MAATIVVLGASAGAPGYAAAPKLADAPADAPQPILDDLDRARTLAPPPGGLSGVIEGSPKPPETPDGGREVAAVVVHARWVTMPGLIFGAFFDHYQTLSNASVGAAYEWGDLDGSMWAVELDWSNLVTDAGNWLEVATPSFGASYAEAGLHMISVDAMYRRQFTITQSFRAMLGGGLGLGVLLGNVQTAEVLPTCVEPVATCAHWPGATNETASLPTRIVPIVHVTAGLELDVGAGFSLRLQAGFRDLLYAGLSVGKTL